MRIRTIAVLVTILQTLVGGCDLGSSGTPATTSNVPYAGTNPYTSISNSILGLYNGLQESNPTSGMTRGSTTTTDTTTTGSDSSGS